MMDWLDDNTSPFISDKDSPLFEDSMYSLIHPFSVHDKDIVEECEIEEGTLYIEDEEDKEDKVKSDIPIKPKQVEIGSIVKEYENWEGRIVATESDFIRARLFNTQKVYSPRMIQISKSVFVSEGIIRQLAVGDMFELSFKRVKTEFLNKKNILTQKENSVESIRMIEPVAFTRREIENIVKKELELLSYLFE